jgi:hypothetical protein
MIDDPKTLWRRQNPDGDDMTLGRLQARIRADQSRQRLRRWLLILETLAGVALTGYVAYSVTSGLLRLGQALLAAGFMGFLALGWRRLATPALDSSETCVAFLSSCLAERRATARAGWLIQVTPLIPGLGVSLLALGLAGRKHPSQLAPLAVLVLVWLAAMVIIRAREAKAIEAEIALINREMTK